MGDNPAARPAGAYFVSPAVDFACMGGLSLLVCAACAVAAPDRRTDDAIRTGALLSWVVNWPHFAATSWRLYHRRENVRAFPLTAIAVPILVVAGMLGALARPADVAPWFVKLFLLWSPWHFSGQTVGLTMLYARRTGTVVDALERRALVAFVFGTFLLQTVRGETGSNQEYWGVAYPAFGLPRWAGTACLWALWVSGAAFALLVLRRCIRERRLVPPIVLLPAASQYVWFVLGSRVHAFQEFVPLFHSLQYLLVAWSLQLEERRPAPGAAVGTRWVLSETAAWYLGNVAAGAFLFWFLPIAFSWSGASLPLSTAVVLAAIQIHHFFVDGVIWKLRDPRVASPLMTSLDSLLHPGAASPALARA